MQNKKIGLVMLVLLITVAIDNVRNLPTVALFGPSLIFFFAVATVFFLLPVGLVSAELSSTWHDKGGVYQWTQIAFGEKIGVLAIWLQWINTMVWYPTILSFIAGTAAFIINPALVQSKLYLVSTILIIFWLITLINLKGLHISAKFASWCAFIGMVIPMLLIVLLGLVWICSNQPLQIQFTAQNIIPHLHHHQSWISLTAIITSFLGMELATVHAKQIKNPQHTFPRALMFSIIFILFTMIFASLAIAVVLPKKQINLVDGLMQAFHNFLSHYHLGFLIPLLAVMILIGSIGNIINWIISPAKGLMQAAQHGYLPKIFARENKSGVSTAVLIAQAILVSLVCVAFLLMPSVNGSYWLLTDLSTELYLLMYALMFIAAIAIKSKFRHLQPTFTIPGGRIGTYVVCLFGIIGCIITLLVGFFPPNNINVGSQLHYFLTFSIGLLIMIVPILLLYFYKSITKTSPS